MSYGRYGLKNNGGNVNIDSFAGRAWNDPWFALGELLAKGYNKNYEDRGTNKAIDAARESLNPNVNNADKANTQAQIDAYNGTKGEQQGLFSAVNPQLTGENPQLPMPTNNGSTFSRDSLNTGLLSGGLQAQSDAQNKAVQDGSIATPSNFYSAQLDQIAKDKRVASWNPNEANATLNKIAQKQNLSPEQRATMMEAVAPMIKQRQQEATKRVIAQMGDYDPTKGYNPKYQQQIAELVYLDPAMAEIYSRNMPTGQQQWANNKAKENAKMQFGYQQAGADANLGRSKSLAAYTAGLKPPANAKIDTTGYDIAMKTIEYEDKLKANNPDYQYSETYHTSKAYANSFSKAVMLGGNTPPPKTPPPKKEINFNDYNQAIPFFSSIMQDGKYNKEEVIAGIRQKYGMDANDSGSEFVEKIILDLGLASQTQKSQPVQPQAPAEPERKYGMTYEEWAQQPAEWRRDKPWIGIGLGTIAGRIRDGGPTYKPINKI